MGGKLRSHPHLLSHSAMYQDKLLKRKKPRNLMFDGFQCGVRSLTIYHDKLAAQQQRSRNNFGNRLFLATLEQSTTTTRTISSITTIVISSSLHLTN